MAEPIEMPFGLRTPVMDPGNHVLDGGSDIRTLYGHRPMCKTAAPIEMPFGFWVRMDSRNHALDGAPQMLRDVAMATNFWLSIG